MSSVGDALHLAGATGRLDAFDFSFDLDEDLHVLVGHDRRAFLMLSYFGCDQSQVQRYLTARSIGGRQSLLMSAYVKIPLQVLILRSACSLRVLPVHRAADAVQPARTTSEVRASSRAARIRGARAASSRQRSTRDAARADVAAARRRGDDAAERGRGRIHRERCRVEQHAARARRRSCARRPATRLHRRQLRVSDVHHHAACRSAWSA